MTYPLFDGCMAALAVWALSLIRSYVLARPSRPPRAAKGRRRKRLTFVLKYKS